MTKRPYITKNRLAALVVLKKYARVFGAKQPGRRYVAKADRELVDVALKFAESAERWADSRDGRGQARKGEARRPTRSPGSGPSTNGNLRALASFRHSTIANAAVRHHGQGGFFAVNVDGRIVTLREGAGVVATYHASVTPRGRLAFA